jgi:hypothetical protein
MSFGPCNRLLKIWKSIRALTFKMRVHFRVWGVDSLTFSYTPGSIKYDSRASFLVRTFASPYFGREPKVRVVIVPLFLWEVIGKEF